MLQAFVPSHVRQEVRDAAGASGVTSPTTSMRLSPRSAVCLLLIGPSGALDLSQLSQEAIVGI